MLFSFFLPSYLKVLVLKCANSPCASQKIVKTSFAALMVWLLPELICSGVCGLDPFACKTLPLRRRLLFPLK